jgi:thioredoxin-related protein
MSRILLSLALAAGCCTTVLAAETPASATAEPVWTEDWDGAKKTAAAQGKDLLIDFTGSDWCGWCIKLHDQVFSTPEFASGSAGYVLVSLDFPRRKEQDPAIKTRNRGLQRAFGVEGFPTVFLADAQGRPYAKTGYKAGGGAVYMAHLAELQQQKAKRDGSLLKAAAAAGAEKARLLDAALSVLGADLPIGPYQAEVEAIIAADADGSAGLRDKYKGMLIESAIQAELAQATDAASALAIIDKALANTALSGQVRQNLLLSKAEITFQGGDKAAVLTLLKDALAAAPEGDKAATLKTVIERLGSETAPAPTP